MRDERRRRERQTRGGSGWSRSGIALSIVLHLLAVAVIFLAPHPLPAPPPTAYTVELVDPNALGGKLLEGPLGGAVAKPQPKAAPEPPPPPPEPEPPPPPPEPEPEPPPEQLAKVDEPPPVPEDDDDPDAVPLGTPIATPKATPTRKADPTALPTKLPTARPTAKPTARVTATVVAKPKATGTAAPKASPTPAVVVAKKASPAPAATRRPLEAVPATPAGEARPKPGPTGVPADDLDGKLAAAIKGVEQKVEKQGGTGGIPGMTGSGSGQGGTERTLDGPAGIGGEGRGGGGEVRGLEYIAYRNRLLNRIKERWTWVGTRTDLRVTIHFSILPSGDFTDIRLVDRSGDQSYDASVERAVKGAGPMSPPPEAYLKDFADVELEFTPSDLRR